MSTTERTKPMRKSKITGLNVPPEKTKSMIGRTILNGNIENMIQDINNQLADIKHQRGPDMPQKPSGLPRKASDEIRETHKREMENYHESMKDYNKYSSPQYDELHTVYEFYTYLSKLRSFRELDKEKADKKYNEIQDIEHILRGQENRLSKRPDEDNEKYRDRINRLKGMNLSRFLENTDLSNVQSIVDRMDQLLDRYPELDLFIRKASLINQKVKINDLSMVSISTIAEEVIRELLTYAITEATDVKNNKKSIRKHHFLSNKIKQSPLYVLFSRLPHYKQLLEREKRFNQYEFDKELAYKDEVINQQKLCARAKRRYTKPDFEYMSFEEHEYIGGYATRTDEIVNDELKHKYQWLGIDTEVKFYNSHTRDFVNDVIKVKKSLVETGVSNVEKSVLEKVQLSAGVKTFLSNIILDVFSVMVNKIRLLLQYSGKKTIKYNSVLTAFKLILSESYRSYGGYIEWSGEHEEIFENISDRVGRQVDYVTNKTIREE